MSPFHETPDPDFEARLGQLVPRTRLDTALLQYEAGYRTGRSESRREVAVYRGFSVGTAALLALAVGLWALDRDGRSNDVTNAPAPIAASPQDVPNDAELATTPEIADDATRHEAVVSVPDVAPPSEVSQPAVEGRYLSPRFASRGASALRWRDLYDPTPLSDAADLATDLSPIPVTTDAAAHGAVAAPEAWSAYPNSRQVRDLLEAGIY